MELLLNLNDIPTLCSASVSYQSLINALADRQRKVHLVEYMDLRSEKSEDSSDIVSDPNQEVSSAG